MTYEQTLRRKAEFRKEVLQTVHTPRVCCHRTTKLVEYQDDETDNGTALEGGAAIRCGSGCNALIKVLA